MVAAAAMAPVQDMINGVIRGINLLRSVMGKTGYDLVHFADNLGTAAVAHISDSWRSAGNDIGGTWREMTDNIANDTSALVGKLQANFEKYDQTVDGTSEKNSDLSARIKATLDGMSDSLGKTAAAHGNAQKAAKEHSDELKKLKETAETALKPVIDGIKETAKETEEARKKIKEKSEEWKRYREDGVKALSDVNAEISKLKKEASDITVRINADRDKSLGERMVSVNEDIAKLNDQIAEKKAQANKDDNENTQKRTVAEKELLILKERQNELSGKAGQAERDSLALSIRKKEAQIEALKAGMDPEIADLQRQLNELAKERDFIQGNAPQKILDEAAAYGSLSKAQQIVADAEREKSKQLEENDKKMQAAVEKRMILEAQARQKSVSDLAIRTDIKDGMITASVELEKGKRVEIRDQENINLANEIAQKQLVLKNEADMLTSQLGIKLQAQKDHIGQTQELYKQFDQFLKDDTKKTADEMIAKLAQVNTQLRETITFRTQAGFAAASTAATAGRVSGARALGGPVDSGKTYLVGENGPELFAPSKSGRIVPNGSAAYAPIVNISLGGVVVQEKADIDRLTNRLSEELARRMQLYKLGIS